MKEMGTRSGQKITRHCPNCSSDFVVPLHFKHRIYCSMACYQAHRKVAPAHRGNQRIAKNCPVCGCYFEAFPSRADARCCSRECAGEARRGQPAGKGNASGLRGRPAQPPVRKSCRTCGAAFEVPFKMRRQIYCGRACRYADSSAKFGPPDSKVAKTCPSCNGEFRLPPSTARRVTCCSKECANTLRKNAQSGHLRDMTQGEIGWLAGLMDGEGSIVLVNRSRGTGSIRIQIANTFVPLIDRILEVTGVGAVVTHPYKNPKHKTGYTWTVGGGDARELLRRMRPWLLVKAERADAVFEGRTFPRQSRWDDIYPLETASVEA